MPLTDLIGDVTDLFTHAPKLQAVGIDSRQTLEDGTQNPNYGQFVDANNNPTPLYAPPNRWQQSFGHIGRQIMDANTQAAGSPLIAQQALQQAEQSSRGLYDTQTQNYLNRAGTFADKSNSNLLPELSGIGALDAPQVGSMQQVQANQANGVPDAQAKAAADVAQRTSAINTPDANPDIIRNLMYQQHTLTPAEQLQQDIMSRNIGLGGASPLMLSRQPDGNWSQERNPTSMMGSYLGGAQGSNGSFPSGRPNNLPPLFSNDNTGVSPYGDAAVHAAGGSYNPTSPTPTPVVPTVAPPHVTPAQAASLIGNIGSGTANSIDSFGNEFNDALSGSMSLLGGDNYWTGGENATAPTQQDVIAQRQALGMPANEPRNLTPLANGYNMDEEGNVYYKGHYVPEEQVKNLPIGKLRTATLNALKAHRDIRAEANLPHNLIGQR